MIARCHEGIIAKMSVHRFYDQLDYTDTLHMMQEELIESGKDSICKHLMEDLRCRLITNNEEYDDLRLLSVKVDNICNQCVIGRCILEEFIRREKRHKGVDSLYDRTKRCMYV